MMGVWRMNESISEHIAVADAIHHWEADQARTLAESTST
jgi:hypothetical protein